MKYDSLDPCPCGAERELNERLADNLVGAMVILHGLTQVNLNGCQDTVIPADGDKMRCGECMDGGGPPKSVRLENLMVVETGDFAKNSFFVRGGTSCNSSA